MITFQKIQGLPERTRKIILWAAVVIVGFILLFFWFRNFQYKMKGISAQNLKETFQAPNSTSTEI